MLDKDKIYTVGEILKCVGLPFFFKIPNNTFDFFLEAIDTCDDGVSVLCRGYKLTIPNENQYSVSVETAASFCEFADIERLWEYIKTDPDVYYPNYSLPRRALGKYHYFKSKDCPPYSPGETIIPVLRNGMWVNAVFTGFEEKAEKIVAYTFYDGKETFYKIGGKYIQKPVDLSEGDDRTVEDLCETKTWTEDRRTILNYFTVQRKVKHLVHFTPVKNLGSILNDGIIPRALLSSERDIVITDAYRADRHQECSCFTLSFPNYRMLYPKRKKMPFAVVLVDIGALMSSNVESVYFLPTNAACDEVWPRITQYTQLRDAKNMFTECYTFKGRSVQRKTLNIPSWYTTNPQAEIMISGVIDTAYIREIHFPNEDVYKSAMINTGNIPSHIKLVVDETLFSKRADSSFWIF